MARSALVIGIARYGSNFRNLEKAVNDAGAIAEILEQHGHYAIEPLPRKLDTTNESRYEFDTDPKKEVKYKDLLARVKSFLTGQAKGKDALIYFAGHGFVAKDDADDDIGYFAATDASNDGQNALSFKIFTSLVAKSELNSLVVLLDCCHAGDLLEKSQYKEMLKVFNDKNYYLMAACRGFERAREGKEHGIFTEAILKVLQVKIKAGESVDVDILCSEVSKQLEQSGQQVERSTMGGTITLIEKARGNIAPMVNETCPYVGLEAFDQKTAQYFYGREEQLDLLLRKIEKSRFVPVIGASGSGKSSLVKAGLMTALEKQGWCVLPPMKPWANPLTLLKQSLVQQFYKLPSEIQKAYARLESEGLNAILPEGSQRVLLVVDQFEELFTVCASEQDRQDFIRLLVDGADREGRLTIATTMRADFVEQALQYSALAKLIQRDRVFWLVPLELSEMKEAIAKPAQMQGYELAEGLLEAICEDVEAEKNSLPLLEFALTELWERRDRQNHRLTLVTYLEMGKLRGALDRHAKRLYEEVLRSDEERKWAKRLFLNLVRTGQDVRDTRQRQSKQFLLGMARSEADREVIANLLEIFAGEDGRLLVASDENNVAFVDLAHEALMDGWEMFVKWRSEDRDLRRLGDRVEDGCKEWELKGKVEGYLLSNGLILEVREQWESIKPLLSIAAQDYFQSSDEYMLVREQLGGANQQLAVLVQELRNLAVLDDLTQLANRRFFDQYLEQECQRSAAEKSPFSLIMCEIDCFKDYVDIYGHMAGDDCIRKVSRIIGKSVNRPADLAANYRGEVFTLVLPNTTEEESLQKAESIKRQVLELKIPHENSMFGKFVTLSVGVTSLFPLVTASSLEILKSVDYALSLTKKSGKNQTQSS